MKTRAALLFSRGYEDMHAGRNIRGVVRMDQ